MQTSYFLPFIETKVETMRSQIIALFSSLWLIWAGNSLVFGQEKTQEEWFDFMPETGNRERNSEIDLRFLNERFAGENGFIRAKNGKFVQGANDEPIRFWAVNGPPLELQGDDLKACARKLAQYGVNLVRFHSAIFDTNGEPDAKKIQRAHEIVAAMKAEGIYTHFSIYFPLWFTPSSNLEWLEGYDGKRHPFAALMFNPKFQDKYREWLKALLVTKNPLTGKALKDEPAVFGIEIQNEDSFFFWTFDEKNIPDAQLRILEKQFGDWLISKYQLLSAVAKRWSSPGLSRDNIQEGRMAFRPLWAIANERTIRDRDTAQFLFETQTKFYTETHSFLKSNGFQGLIHASNWATASPEVLGPLEKMSYASCDFVDRHGYFECSLKGENSAWSIRPEHTFNHRSALRFDPDTLGKPKQFVHPVMDPEYNSKPSMISETTFTRPNRYRSEAPLYFACYGALQDTDCIVHFAFDGDLWSVKPNYWMQPWTLATPSMMGQFPASALLYRRGLVSTGKTVASVKLNTKELLNLRGTPLPQDASFDELRLQNIQQDDQKGGASRTTSQRLDPLLHYVGRSQVLFSNDPPTVSLTALGEFIDRKAQTVRSVTGELKLNYQKGSLIIDSPRAQGVSGNLSAIGKVELSDISIQSPLDLAHIIVVPLDDKPLATADRILLQVMTEERSTGFATESLADGTVRILELGQNPWQVKSIAGKLAFRRQDAKQLKVKRLSLGGQVVAEHGTSDSIDLDPTTLYYLISKD